MTKKNVSPLLTWTFWGIMVPGVFLLVTWNYFVAGFSADSSNISYLILLFFGYGFLASLRVAFYLQNEDKVLKQMDVSNTLSAANSSDAAGLLHSALGCIQRGDQIDMKNLITSYSTKLKSKVDNVSVISGMLVTIGLLGTVVGLIIAVNGLGRVLMTAGIDFEAMKSGLNETFSGMGSALYTTFFGALLGGVILKVLGAEMRKSAAQLVANTLRFSELFLAPKISKASSDGLIELESRVMGLGDQLGQLGSCFTSVIETIDAKQTELATGLSDLVLMMKETIENTNEQANQRLELLTNTVTQTTESTQRMADERLEALLGAVEKASEDTYQKANDRLVVLVDQVGQSIDQSRREAEERLGAKTSDLAQKLSEAATVLTALSEASAEELQLVGNESRD